ncbi:MAG TPA: type IV pilus biogenesis/stability protein PilW [Casimicrobiaceae bacterium]|jgi:type IV pilus assembly protein PilF
MRIYALLGMIAALLVAGCASNKPAQTASPEALDPVKTQETSPQRRAQIKTDLAAGYYERGQFDVALEVLDEAQKLDPNYPKTYNVFGLVYTMLGETPKAEASFQRGLSLAPNDPDLRANWGAFLCATGRPREAIPELETALRDPLYKSPEIALINAGKCSAALGENKKADEYFRRALGASPGNSIAAYNLALLAYREARLDDARSWMRPVMRDASPRAEALYLGMCIERKQGDRQAEISYMTQLRNRYPDSPEAKAVVATRACE